MLALRRRSQRRAGAACSLLPLARHGRQDEIRATLPMCWDATTNSNDWRSVRARRDGLPLAAMLVKAEIRFPSGNTQRIARLRRFARNSKLGAHAVDRGVCDRHHSALPSPLDPLALQERLRETLAHLPCQVRPPLTERTTGAELGESACARRMTSCARQWVAGWVLQNSSFCSGRSRVGRGFGGGVDSAGAGSPARGSGGGGSANAWVCRHWRPVCVESSGC